MSGFTGFLQLSQPRNGAGAMIVRAFHVIGRMVRVAMSRRYLAEMDDHMLHDLGISRAQACFEASRPIWQLDAKSD